MLYNKHYKRFKKLNNNNNNQKDKYIRKKLIQIMNNQMKKVYQLILNKMKIKNNKYIVHKNNQKVPKNKNIKI